VGGISKPIPSVAWQIGDRPIAGGGGPPGSVITFFCPSFCLGFYTQTVRPWADFVERDEDCVAEQFEQEVVLVAKEFSLRVFIRRYECILFARNVPERRSSCIADGASTAFLRSSFVFLPPRADGGQRPRAQESAKRHSIH